MQPLPRNLPSSSPIFRRHRSALKFIAVAFSGVALLAITLIAVLLPNAWLTGLVMALFCLAIGALLYILYYRNFQHMVRILNTGAVANGYIINANTGHRSVRYLEVAYTDKYGNSFTGLAPIGPYHALTAPEQFSNMTVPVYYDEANTRKFVVYLENVGVFQGTGK